MLYFWNPEKMLILSRNLLIFFLTKHNKYSTFRLSICNYTKNQKGEIEILVVIFMSSAVRSACFTSLG
jgi:hypothetical protein